MISCPKEAYEDCIAKDDLADPAAARFDEANDDPVDGDEDLTLASSEFCPLFLLLEGLLIFSGSDVVCIGYFLGAYPDLRGKFFFAALTTAYSGICPDLTNSGES